MSWHSMILADLEFIEFRQAFEREYQREMRVPSRNSLPPRMVELDQGARPERPFMLHHGRGNHTRTARADRWV